MSAVIVGIIGLAWLGLGYWWYARRLDRRILFPNEGDPTPAVNINDRQDYVPTHPLILFGHHFWSIAGAGVSKPRGFLVRKTAMRAMRKPYKTPTFGISVPKPLEIHELSERCGSVLSGGKTQILPRTLIRGRVYLETI